MTADRIDKDNCVLIVIDVQNDFCDPQGLAGRSGSPLDRVDRAVDQIEAMADLARQHGVPVVFVRTIHDENTDTPQWLDRHVSRRPRQTCAPDSWGAEFYRLAPEPGDLIVEKHRYSAFAGTSLEADLHRLGRRSLLFAGVSTAVCVDTSLRDAVCRNFVASVIEDCCGEYAESIHRHALEVIGKNFGMVVDYHAVRERWQNGPLARA